MQEKIKVRVKRLVPEAKLPEVGSQHAAGFDLVATSKTMDKTGQYIQYGTGIKIEIPVGYCGLLQSRSSVRNFSLMLSNGIGLIDCDYRGELLLCFKPVRPDIAQTAVEYKVGEKIGQIRFCAVPEVVWEDVGSGELGSTERGDGGFGSTDTKKKKKIKK